MGLEQKITFRDSVTEDQTSKKILTPEALRFVAELAGEFTNKRNELLAKREERQQKYNAGELPHFLESTKHIRDGNWSVARHPNDLQKRWVEITGPASNPKMVINAFNSGADCYMADFEDSDVPTWQNLMNGQANLMDAVDWNLAYHDKEKNKTYKLNDTVATLLVRPRGWHLDEKHVLFEGKPIPGSLFDFGLFFFHNARGLLCQDATPSFYLPKMESHEEARLWNNVFQKAQDYLNIREGTVRATVLIETLPAAFEMEEILYELKDHISGLNCGRWDYIFSYIKKLNQHKDQLLPDRDQVTMTQPFLQSYVNLLIQTCHKRGAYAMGGMAAQIPINPEKGKTAEEKEALKMENEKAMEKVRADKEREVAAGHDGTWVAHPGLVPLAREIFEKGMKERGYENNQLEYKGEEVQVTEADLLRVPEGTFTYENGLKKNIKIGIKYTEAWLQGIGCVPLDGLMEDAATAEISRAQLWQWLRHQVILNDGRMVTPKLYMESLLEVSTELMGEMSKEVYCGVKPDKNNVIRKFPDATSLFSTMIEQQQKDHFEDFLTKPAYEHIVREGR